MPATNPPQPVPFRHHSDDPAAGAPEPVQTPAEVSPETPVAPSDAPPPASEPPAEG